MVSWADQMTRIGSWRLQLLSIAARGLVLRYRLLPSFRLSKALSTTSNIHIFCLHPHQRLRFRLTLDIREVGRAYCLPVTRCKYFRNFRAKRISATWLATWISLLNFRLYPIKEISILILLLKQHRALKFWKSASALKSSQSPIQHVIQWKFSRCNYSSTTFGDPLAYCYWEVCSQVYRLRIDDNYNGWGSGSEDFSHT